MSLPEPVKKAIELVPPKWQTLVITPILLLLVGALGAYVYTAKSEASASVAADVSVLKVKEAVRTAHDEDRDRRLLNIERSVRRIERDFAYVVGDRKRAERVQGQLDQMPPEDNR